MREAGGYREGSPPQMGRGLVGTRLLGIAKLGVYRRCQRAPGGEPNRYTPRGTQKPRPRPPPGVPIGRNPQRGRGPHAPRPTPPPYLPRDPSHISHLVKLTGNHTPGAPQNPRPHTRADPSYPRPAGRVVRRGRHREVGHGPVGRPTGRPTSCGDPGL